MTEQMPTIQKQYASLFARTIRKKVYERARNKRQYLLLALTLNDRTILTIAVYTIEWPNNVPVVVIIIIMTSIHSKQDFRVQNNTKYNKFSMYDE